jgi:NAD(P)-dependent dehydrogenase (short-subunit alcohol dehydrogenase family)
MAALSAERMSPEFENKVVVIGGGVGELGGPVSSGFAARGAKVVIPFVSEMKLATFVGQYPDAAKSIRFQRCDLASPRAVEQFVESVRRNESRVDVLVNLTGGYRPGNIVAESGIGEFNAMLKMNFTTIYHLTRELLPLMVEQRSGQIVNVASRGGLTGYSGQAAYAIAKSAVMRFTEALSDEVKHNGIGVNCLLPSIIDTPRNRMEMPDARHDHWVRTEDLAEVIFFLASERSRAIQGASIPAYGLA